MHHHTGINPVFVCLTQRQSPLVDEHAGALGARQDPIRAGHRGAQRIELLSGLLDRLGAANVLIVAGRTDRPLAQTNPRILRGFDAVVAVTDQTLGLANRFENGLFRTGSEQFGFAHMTLRTDIDDVAYTGWCGTVAPMAGAAGWR
jgi:hypothetical protein